MNSNVFYKEIKDLIAKNKIEVAFEKLHIHLQKSQLLKYLNLFSSSYIEVDKKKRYGIISIENENIEKNKITLNLLTLIEVLEKNGPNFNGEIKFPISEKAHTENHYYKSAEYNELIRIIEDSRSLMEFNKGDENEVMRHGKRLAIAQKQLKEFISEINSLSEIIQKSKYDTDRLSKASSLFSKGMYKEAREILDPNKMTFELELMLEEKKQIIDKNNSINNNLKSKSNEFLVLAKLTSINYKVKNWFEKSDEYFRNSITANSNLDNLFSYAKFLQLNNKKEHAVIFYKKVLAKFTQGIDNKTTSDKFTYIYSTINLANLYMDKKDFNSAKPLYENAIANLDNSLLQDLQGKITFSNLLINHATFYIETNAFNKAENETLKALNINKEINYQYGIASAYNNLGIINKNKRELKKAQSFYELGLNTSNDIINDNNEEHLACIVDININLGDLFQDQNKLDESEKSYKEAYKILDRLVAKNPYSYKPRLGTFFLNIGTSNAKNGNFEEAEKELINSCIIFTQLAKVEPGSYLANLGIGQLNLAILYKNKKIKFDIVVKLLKSSIQNLTPFKNIQYLNHYLEGAKKTLATIT